MPRRLLVLVVLDGVVFVPLDSVQFWFFVFHGVTSL